MQSYTEFRCNTINYCGSFLCYIACSIATRATASPVHSSHSRSKPMLQHLLYIPFFAQSGIGPKLTAMLSRLCPVVRRQVSAHTRSLIYVTRLTVTLSPAALIPVYIPCSGSHSLDLVMHSTLGCVFQVKYFYSNKYEWSMSRNIKYHMGTKYIAERNSKVSRVSLTFLTTSLLRSCCTQFLYWSLPHSYTLSHLSHGQTSGSVHTHAPHAVSLV